LAIALLKTRRRKIVLVVLLSVLSLFVGSRWLFSRVTPVDRDRATQQFRQEKARVNERTRPTAGASPIASPSSTATGLPLNDVQVREPGRAPAGALDRPVAFRPAEGTYEYDTDGFETITGGYRRTFPKISYRNVVYQGSTSWQEHHIFMEERHFWNDLSFDGNSRLIHSTRQLAWWGNSGIKIDRTIIFDPPLRGTLLPWREGRRWQGRFEGDTYGTYTAFTRQHGRMPVGPEHVEYWFDELNITLHGDVEGTVLVRRWISPRDGVVLREYYDADAKVGPLTYRAAWTVSLLSLTPST
jgi:hypothetical protein